MRDTVEVAGVGYLGVVAGKRDGRAAVIVLAISITVMEFPAGADPASLVAATLRREYPQAVVEEFATASGTGVVGMQRHERDHGSGIAVSQALVPFADAGLLGAVSGGAAASMPDVEMAMVLTAAIAHRMRVVAG